ncbi:MAG: hypothetical protein JWL68_2165 [Actinomycetia bacterium]|nr:hypothetical protein [Actinomycetes bacterium]
MRTPRLPGRQPSTGGRSDLTLVTGDQAQPAPRAAGRTPASPAGDTLQPVPVVAALHSVDLAEADRRRRRAPRAVMRLARTRAGHPGRSSRPAIRALVAEQEGIAAPHDPGEATYGETVVRGIAKRRADGLIRRTARRIGWMAGRTGRLKVRRAFLYDRISFQPDEHVRHPDGGRRTFARTLAEHAALDRRVAAERNQGSRKHHRLPRWFRWLPRVVLIFDFFLLLYFLSGITNVNWRAPMSPELTFAAGLAAMITVVSYGCFAFAGHRLRMHKDHSGTVPAADLDGLTTIIVGACAGGLIVLGLLMFARMRSEVLMALGNGATATAVTVAAALTAVSVLANIMVISVHALDGSDEIDRLGALAGVLSRSQVRADRMQRRAARLEHIVARRVLKAERVAAGGISRAGRPIALADQAIDNARAIHQGAGTLSEITDDPNGQPGTAGYRQPDATPRVDERPLRRALIEAASPLPSETRSRPARTDRRLWRPAAEPEASGE